MNTHTHTAAEAAVTRAIDAFNHWRADAMSHLDSALAADPDSPRAHTVKGLFLATGRNRRYQAMIDASLAAARRGEHAAIPAARAAIAHRRSDHAEVAQALLPARRALWQMGGSHAQRDVFWQILVDSLQRLGLRPRLAGILDEIRAVPFAELDQRSLYRDANRGAVTG